MKFDGRLYMLNRMLQMERMRNYGRITCQYHSERTYLLDWIDRETDRIKASKLYRVLQRLDERHVKHKENQRITAAQYFGL